MQFDSIAETIVAITTFKKPFSYPLIPRSIVFLIVFLGIEQDVHICRYIPCNISNKAKRKYTENVLISNAYGRQKCFGICVILALPKYMES